MLYLGMRMKTTRWAWLSVVS